MITISWATDLEGKGVHRSMRCNSFFNIYFYLFIWLCWVLVAACGLLAVACEIQFPDQGQNPCVLHWEHGVLATGPSGKSQDVILLKGVSVWAKCSGTLVSLRITWRACENADFQHSSAELLIPQGWGGALESELL